MAGNIHDAVAYALSRVGWAYCNEGPWRLDGSRHCYDCSGLVYASVRAAGGPASFPTNSDAQARYCRQQRTTITVAEGLRTYGALLFRETQNVYDGVGHVVFSLGDGRRTVEAMSHRMGIVVGNSDPAARGWSEAARVPTMTYAATSPPADPTLPPIVEEPDMDLPTATLTGPHLPWPTVALDTKNRKVLAYHGAKVQWRGGTPASGQHEGSRDPYTYTIPGTEPVISLEVVSRQDTRTVFVVTGLAGGQYVANLIE